MPTALWCPLCLFWSLLVWWLYLVQFCMCVALRCGAVRSSAERGGAVQCGAVRCGAVRCGAVRSVRFGGCGAVRDAVLCEMRCGAWWCGVRRCGPVRCGECGVAWCGFLQAGARPAQCAAQRATGRVSRPFDATPPGLNRGAGLVPGMQVAGAGGGERRRAATRGGQSPSWETSEQKPSKRGQRAKSSQSQSLKRRFTTKCFGKVPIYKITRPDF